jgi:hypothetical protein
VATAVRNYGDNKPGSIFGLKVPDGEALEVLFRDLVAKDVAPEYREFFKFDLDKPPCAKIHGFETANLAREAPRLAPMLGAAPNLMGFSKDALWMTAGAKGRETIHAALQDTSKPTPSFFFEMNTKALAELIPSEIAKLDDVHATLTDEHPGRLRLTLEGGADLRLRGSLDLTLFSLATKFQTQLEMRPAKP